MRQSAELLPCELVPRVALMGLHGDDADSAIVFFRQVEIGHTRFPLRITGTHAVEPFSREALWNSSFVERPRLLDIVEENMSIVGTSGACVQPWETGVACESTTSEWVRRHSDVEACEHEVETVHTFTHLTRSDETELSTVRGQAAIWRFGSFPHSFRGYPGSRIQGASSRLFKTARHGRVKWSGPDACT